MSAFGTVYHVVKFASRGPEGRRLTELPHGKLICAASAMRGERVHRSGWWMMSLHAMISFRWAAKELTVLRPAFDPSGRRFIPTLFRRKRLGLRARERFFSALLWRLFIWARDPCLWCRSRIQPHPSPSPTPPPPSLAARPLRPPRVHRLASVLHLDVCGTVTGWCFCRGDFHGFGSKPGHCADPGWPVPGLSLLRFCACALASTHWHAATLDACARRTEQDRLSNLFNRPDDH